MNGLRIEWIQASFFIEMLVITWILMIPMKKREHFWQQGVLLVLAGSVIAAMDTNSNIKFILETAMIGFIAYRVYVISWTLSTHSPTVNIFIPPLLLVRQLHSTLSTHQAKRIVVLQYSADPLSQ